MSSTVCIRCHRELTDPNSIDAGIGPVCNAKGVGSGRAHSLNFPQANYSIVSQDEERVLIKDIGPWDQYMTVTNAAEQVVAELADMLRGRRLLYIDSEGVTDELLVENGKFAGFRHIESARAAA